MYAVCWTMHPAAIKLAGYLSGMRGSIRTSFSAPFFSTVSIAYTLVPTGTPTTFTPPRSAMRTPIPPRKALSSGVGVCPFEGKAIYFVAFIAMPMLASSHWRKGITSIVSAVTSIIPMLMSSR